MRALAAHRRANTTVMFAMFAAMITLSVMSLSQHAKDTVLAAIGKQITLRF